MVRTRGKAGAVIATIAAALALTITGQVGTAIAQDDIEISFAITGFGDQTCDAGSSRLVTGSAEPFTVEFCAKRAGSPESGYPLTVTVTHGDGSTESIELETGADGAVSLRVTPTSAGTTTVSVCDGGGCDHGSVEMEASDPPRPPAVASYLGPTTDMGPSAAIEDGTDDHIDAYTGEAAEAGAGDAAADIQSFRYLGSADGVARFEITTLADLCKVIADGDAKMLIVTVRVETPDGANYVAGWQHSDVGAPSASASSDGARLESVTVDADFCSKTNTIVLSATNVDVPPGSTVRATVWLSTDQLSSGFRDEAEAVPTATDDGATADDPGSTGTDDDTATSDDAATSGTPIDDGDAADSDGGGNSTAIILVPLVIGGVLVGYSVLRRRPEDEDGGAATDTTDTTDGSTDPGFDDAGEVFTALAQGLAGEHDAGAGPDPEDEWTALIIREDELQTELEDDFEALLTQVGGAFQRYLTEVDRYRTNIAPVNSALVDFDRSSQVGQAALGEAKTADFLWAVLTIGKSAGTIGFKTYKWLRTPRAPQTATTALGRAADEIGVDLDEFIAGFPTKHAGESALLAAVARGRGWTWMPTWSEWTLKRILYNVQSARAGGVAHIPYADIERLREWAQRPGFWDDLARAANGVQGPGGELDDIAKAFTDEDIAFLRLIAESGDLGRMLDNVDDALKHPGAFDAPAELPISHYFDSLQYQGWKWQQAQDAARTHAPAYADTIPPSYGPATFDGRVTILEGGRRGSGAAARNFRGMAPEALGGGPRPFDPGAQDALDTWRGAYGGQPPTTWPVSETWWHRSPIPPTDIFSANTVRLSPTPPAGFAAAETVVPFRFSGPLTDATVDIFPTGPSTIFTHAGGIDEVADVAGALRTGPGGTVVLAGDGAVDIARGLDPSSRFTTSTLPDGSVSHGPGALDAAAQSGGVLAVHGPDVAAGVLNDAARGAAPFLDAASGADDLGALDVILSQGLLNRAAQYVGLTENGFSVLEGGLNGTMAGFFTDPGLGAVGYPSAVGVDVDAVHPSFGQWGTGDVEFGALFDEVGLDVDLWMAGHTADPEHGMGTLLAEAAQRRGLHPVAEPIRDYLDDLVEDTRRYAAGAGPAIDQARVDTLRSWAQNPDFYPWLTTSVVPVDGGYVFPYDMEDAATLNALVVSGGEQAGLRAALGPARVRAYTAIAANNPPPGTSSGPPAADVAAHAHLNQVATNYGTASHTSHVGIDQWLQSFGPVGQIDDDFTFWFFGSRTVERGSSATFLNAWWSFFSAPIETYTSWWWTDEAYDQFHGLLDAQGENLSEMVTSMAAGVRALEDLLGALDVLDDPDVGFSDSNRSALDDVLNEMIDMYGNAPPDWRDANQDRYDEKTAHIRTKLANSGDALDMLRALREKLPQMIEWLNGLRLDENGELRHGYQLINPEVATRLGSVALALHGLTNPAMLTATPNADARQGRPQTDRPVVTAEEAEAMQAERAAAFDAMNQQADDADPFDVADDAIGDDYRDD